MIGPKKSTSTFWWIVGGGWKEKRVRERERGRRKGAPRFSSSSRFLVRSFSRHAFSLFARWPFSFSLSLPYVDRHRDLGLPRLQVVEVGRRRRPPALERDRVLREAVRDGREEGGPFYRRRCRRRRCSCRCFRHLFRRRGGARRCCASRCCASRGRGGPVVGTSWPREAGGADEWWAHAGAKCKKKGKKRE